MVDPLKPQMADEAHRAAQKVSTEHMGYFIGSGGVTYVPQGVYRVAESAVRL